MGRRSSASCGGRIGARSTRVGPSGSSAGAARSSPDWSSTVSLADDLKTMHAEMTSWRRDIHIHPEIGFEEERTSALVAAKLAEFGCEVHRGIAGTGVVGVLRSGNGTGSVGLRAEMDALPIEETNEVPYRSQIKGR